MRKGGIDGVKVDVKELEKLSKKLEEVEKESKNLTKAVLNDMALRLLRQTMKGTPVDTGHLRNSWHLGSIKKRGGYYEIVMSNNALSDSGEPYAAYVEYGHRLVRNGVTLGWVKGQFMMTIAESLVEREKEHIIKKRINRYLKGAITL